jgi:hypothetical protein
MARFWGNPMNRSFLAASIFCIAIISGCATPYNEPKYDDKIVEEYISTLDKNFNTIGFKGLHVNMTFDQVNALVANTPWGYSFPSYGKSPDDPQFKTPNLLGGDYSNQGYNWAKIGCEGQEGQGSCFFIRSAFVEFYNGKIAKMTLASPEYTADKIDTKVIEWGKFALKGLIKKYGNPSVTNNTFDEINILSFKPGFSSFLYQWNVNQHEVIILALSEYESKFSCSIIFQDSDATSKIADEKSKGVTEF